MNLGGEPAQLKSGVTWRAPGVTWRAQGVTFRVT
jgi:hypothetical protein